MDLRTGWLRGLLLVFAGLVVVTMDTMFQVSFELINTSGIQKYPTTRELHASSPGEEEPMPLMMKMPSDNLEKPEAPGSPVPSNPQASVAVSDPPPTASTTPSVVVDPSNDSQPVVVVPSSSPTPLATESFKPSVSPTVAAPFTSSPNFRGVPSTVDSISTAPPTETTSNPEEVHPVLGARLDVGSQKKCEKLSDSHVDKRFVPRNLCLSRADIQQIIINLVHVAAEHFEANKLTYWLDSGTLLGSYREHTVIPYDVDADFGMDEQSFQRLQNSLVIDLPHPYLLSVLQSSHYDGQGRDRFIPLRVINTQYGLYLDVFVFLESFDALTRQTMVGPLASICFWNCVRCTKTGGYTRHFLIPRDWVFPLKRCEFAGRQVFCPQESAKYLDFLYGDDFMTPDQT